FLLVIGVFARVGLPFEEAVEPPMLAGVAGLLLGALLAFGERFGLDRDEASAVVRLVAPVFEPGAAEAPEEEGKTADEAPVADAVDHEGLHPRGGLLVVLVPEADEQIAAEADALPAEE